MQLTKPEKYTLIYSDRKQIVYSQPDNKLEQFRKDNEIRENYKFKTYDSAIIKNSAQKFMDVKQICNDLHEILLVGNQQKQEVKKKTNQETNGNQEKGQVLQIKGQYYHDVAEIIKKNKKPITELNIYLGTIWNGMSSWPPYLGKALINNSDMKKLKVLRLFVRHDIVSDMHFNDLAKKLNSLENLNIIEVVTEERFKVDQNKNWTLNLINAKATVKKDNWFKEEPKKKKQDKKEEGGKQDKKKQQKQEDQEKKQKQQKNQKQ